MTAQVHGYCPMGCGETLYRAGSGQVLCARLECPDPTAVATILGEPETEHVVLIEETTFSVQHPLRERVAGELFVCGLHQWLSGLASPPAPPGRYRLTGDSPRTWTFELLERSP